MLLGSRGGPEGFSVLNLVQYRNASKRPVMLTLGVQWVWFPSDSSLFQNSKIKINDSNKNPPTHCGGTEVTLSDRGVSKGEAEASVPQGPFAATGRNNLLTSWIFFLGNSLHF